MSDRADAFEEYMERAYGRAWDHYLPNESIQYAQAGFFAGFDAACKNAVSKVVNPHGIPYAGRGPGYVVDTDALSKH